MVVVDVHRPAVAATVTVDWRARQRNPLRRHDSRTSTAARIVKRLTGRALPAGAGLLASACSGWLNWHPDEHGGPKSDFGRTTHGIFMLISWWTLGIFIAVEGILLYCCWRFRDRPGAPIPKQVHGHTVLEISWTVAFAVILLIIAIPTIQAIFKTQEAPAATALRVNVAGKQWWWEFRYRSTRSRPPTSHLPAAGDTLPTLRRHPLLLIRSSGRATWFPTG
jgi:hypothetical protein